MKISLPQGFNSWSEVITDSAVSRALQSAKVPPCLADHRELAAPLVREMSIRLHELLFLRRVAAVHFLEAKITESVFGHVGGENYYRLREALSETQTRFFELYREETDSAERQARDAEMTRAQEEFVQLQRRHASTVQSTVTAALREHWTVQEMARMPDTIFADVEFSFSASRLARIHPAWWGRFFGRLQVLFKQGHPAHGEFLDALPKLTTETGLCTIEGAIYEWRKTRNDYWGWYRNENHRVLAMRAADKAIKLNRWYARVAPGFLADMGEREKLHARLVERLAAADPWHVPGEQAAGWLAGMHGRN